VLDFLVARYGEFVLLRPPFEWHTLLLWGASPAVLLGGMIALIVIARRRRIGTPASLALSDAEQRRVEALLDRDVSKL
jgi:cytochrome c-type biogenesis protein CcmH